MKNRTVIGLVLVSISAATFTWLLASSPKQEMNVDSRAEPPGTFGKQYQDETPDDQPEQTGEAKQIASESSFECSAEFDSSDLDLYVVAEELSKSDDPEHLMMAALYGSDRATETGLYALSRTLRIDPNNRLVMYNLLYACSRFPETSICHDLTIENHSIEVDGSNGQLWARIAGFRIKRGNMSAALGALRNATAAPRFSDYRMEHIQLFERGLAAAGNAPYRERVIHAIGMQAALVSTEYFVTRGCQTMAAESAEWLQQCIRFGERMEVDGRSVFTVASGQNLQKKMLSISGDKEKEEAVEERLQRTRELMQSGLTEDSQVLLSRDDQVLASYLTESAIHGELRALEFLNEEVERLKALPGYNPCTL